LLSWPREEIKYVEKDSRKKDQKQKLSRGFDEWHLTEARGKCADSQREEKGKEKKRRKITADKEYDIKSQFWKVVRLNLFFV